MLFVDTVKRIVYEARDINMALLPRRCKKITELGRYPSLGYRFFDLSEFVIVASGLVVGSRSWKSRADAEYEIKRMHLDACTVRRASDVLDIM